MQCCGLWTADDECFESKRMGRGSWILGMTRKILSFECPQILNPKSETQRPKIKDPKIRTYHEHSARGVDILTGRIQVRYSILYTSLGRMCPLKTNTIEGSACSAAGTIMHHIMPWMPVHRPPRGILLHGQQSTMFDSVGARRGGRSCRRLLCRLQCC
jgi:hypothetical protein